MYYHTWSTRVVLPGRDPIICFNMIITHTRDGTDDVLKKNTEYALPNWLLRARRITNLNLLSFWNSFFPYFLIFLYPPGIYCIFFCWIAHDKSCRSATEECEKTRFEKKEEKRLKKKTTLIINSRHTISTPHYNKLSKNRDKKAQYQSQCIRAGASSVRHTSSRHG